MGKLTLEYVSAEFEKGSCRLLSKLYTNNRTPMAYVCRCGQESKISYENFRQGKRCKKCKRQGGKPKLTLEYAKQCFEEQGCKLLSTKYTSVTSPMAYICQCGNEAKISLRSIRLGGKCQQCKIRKLSGKNNYGWNTNLSEHERVVGRNYATYKTWRQKVYQRDDFTCQVCHKQSIGDLNAHHLNSYSKYPESRLDVDNGITICEQCHSYFHDVYGNRHNTKGQFEEFLTILLNDYQI